jgi:large subunit ribosomal protein L7/L12
MAKLTKETLIESLNEMTILEINELVEAMKEAYGVDPSAVAAAPAAQAGAAADAAPSTVNVELKEVGPNKIAVIKVIREITGLGLKDAKDIADNGGVIKENVSSSEADEMKAKFEEAGATVEFK